MSATAVRDPAGTQPGQCWLFDIAGMDCGDCARTIEAGVRRLPGISAADVNFGAATLTVVPASDTVSPNLVVAAVTQAGYRASQRGDEQESHVPWWRERRVHEIAVAALLWVIGFVAHHAGASTAIVAVPYLGAMAIAGYPVARAAVFAAKARRADMNVLMTIAAIGALPLGEWDEGSSVLLLFAVGLLLQSQTVERTRRAIQELSRLAPDVASIRRDGQEHRVPVAEVAIDEIAIVRPGERIPLDGVVAAGNSEIDQSAITGESMPVDVSAGSSVFAGTMNGHGALEIRVTKRADASTLSGIVRMVQDAQATQAPAQALVDRFAAIYTPVVVVGAIVLALGGALLTGDGHAWLMRGLVLLVVACPCALVISTPVALVSAIGSAARKGVLFKGAAAIEALAGIRTVAFDKTGTLTHGRPAVSSIAAVAGMSDDDLLALAASVEQGSRHPIARGITAEAHNRGITLRPVSDAMSTPGQGARGRVDGVDLAVLAPRMVSALPAELASTIADLESRGETVVVVTQANVPAGAIGLIDPPRAASRRVILQLRSLGLRTVMVSGDNARVAHRVAQGIGLDDVRAGLLPADKVTAIAELGATGPVAMVGDGVNDAPALATAAVGIAMGAAGSEVAIEAADVALMGDDIEQLPRAIALSRRTLRIIRENIAAAIIVKVAFIALTVAGITNLWLAVAADTGMSLLVTANALRLLRQERAVRH